MSTTMSHVMSTYGRYPVAFVRGEGCRVWDDTGKEYLDFLSGIGVNNLGHCHPAIVEALCRQAATLIHTSNLYRIPLQEQLAERLTERCFADQVFFCNSGAEANEAAIKLVRKYWDEHGEPHRHVIITADKSFHGRTMATLSATGQEKVKRGFEPLVPGFRHVPYNDPVVVEASIDVNTAAILVEPIQGESGVRIPAEGYLEALREIADRHRLLLVFDEVQSGMGRTGRMWAHQWSTIGPDIMTAAKGIAAGVPMGACLASKRVAASFQQGSHASTFGGNPLACAAALATQAVMTPAFLDQVVATGDYFLDQLRQVGARYKWGKEARGRGMMLALELNCPAEEVASLCLSRGLLLNCAMGTVLRLLPPLVATRAEVDQAVAILDLVLNDLF